MPDTAIQITGLGKRYRYGGATGAGGNLREDITNWAKGLFRRNGKGHPTLHDVHDRRIAADSSYFWALKDINLEIQQGETVGIIGRNGAGKSTLLKILSRITPPTTGKIEYHGRIASLLEVGTGFHRELTGRENIFLNGSILGMKRSEIVRKFDEIVAFAEVEKFIDTPVKFYSSGMYVRLAFAVAAHLEPEILVVDEVLAVGDASFQKKCLGKMGDVAKEGRTVLFVSHNMTAVSALCVRAVCLEEGSIRVDGKAQEVIKQYLFLNSQVQQSRRWDSKDAPGNENLRVLQMDARPSVGEVISIDSGVDIEVLFHNAREGRNIDFTFYLQNEHGILLFETGINITRDSDSRRGVYKVQGHIPPHLLNAGRYSGSILFGEDQCYPLFRMDDVLSFEVANTATGRGSNLSVAPGVIRPLMKWEATLKPEPANCPENQSRR